MGIRLAVSDLVEFPVLVSISDQGGALKPFKLTLLGDRLVGDDFQAEAGKIDAARDALRDDPGGNAYFDAVRDIVVRRVRGWVSQDLVLDDLTGEPAPFSPEAFAAALGVAGLPMLIFKAYFAAQGAREGN